MASVRKGCMGEKFRRRKKNSPYGLFDMAFTGTWPIWRGLRIEDFQKTLVRPRKLCPMSLCVVHAGGAPHSPKIGKPIVADAVRLWRSVRAVRGLKDPF
ncbi:hypothetical protein N7454_009258 [Penicillium verhagenii]|nr:hypothetical protein N7454_009258 [Penicillium verhagenii]